MPRITRLLLALWGTAFLLTTATQSAFSFDSKAAGTDRDVRVAFEPNQGQTSSEVRFLARDRNSVLFLTEKAALLKVLQSTKQRRGENTSVGAVLRFSWVGANDSPMLYPEERLAGEVNYFRGANSVGRKPAITQLPRFARVTYRNLYRDVDLSFHSKCGLLEFDFVVAPHADAGKIAFSVEGAEGIHLDARGDVVLATGGEEVRQHKPVAYQWFSGKPRNVPVSYVLRGTTTIGFKIGAYDAARPLVIDPAISYSTYLGGSDLESGDAIAVDSSGRAYITGSTLSADFPTKNAFQPSRHALQAACFEDSNSFQQEAFVTKLWATGGGLIYSTYLGGESEDSGRAIAVDSSGHAYVAGQTCSKEFPTTPGAAQEALHGANDAFITKLSSSGSALIYSSYLGGVNDEAGAAIALDSSNRAYVAGFTASTDFPLKNPFQAALGGEMDVFVTRLSADGKSLSYSTYLGGDRADTARGIAVDSSNRAYVTGEAFTNFPTTPGAFQTSNAGGHDAFVTKLWATGAGLIYSTYLGGTDPDAAWGIAIDSSGRAYVTGITNSLDFPITSGAFQRRVNGVSEAFVTRLNSTGSALSYSTYLGGSGDDRGLGIAVNGLGQAHVTGWTNSSDFPTKNRVQGFNRGADSLALDAFVTKLWANGGGLHYSTYLGGSSVDRGQGIRLDNSGNAYVTGWTSSEDFPTTSGAFQRTFKGFVDGFVTKIAP